MKNEFTTFETMKILNITRSRLREWLDIDMIKASIQESTGKGVSNLFSRWDLYGLHILNTYKNSFLSTIGGIHIFLKWQEATRGKSLDDKKNIDYFVFARTRKELMPGAVYGDDTMHLLSKGEFERIKEDMENDFILIINMKTVFDFVDSRIT